MRALRKFDKAFCLPAKRTGEREAAKEAVAALGLRGSAGERMLEWALGAASRLADGLRYVINQDQYDKLCMRTCRDLLREWRGERGEKLGFGAASRAVDLLMMALAESSSCRRESATGFLRSPLDSRTLAPLRRIVDQLTDVDFSIDIPAKPGSGYVASEELYYILQGAVAELARRAETAQITYAYWCAAG